MNYPHLAGLLYNTPLMLSRSKAEAIEAVFRTHIRGGTLPDWNPPQRERIEAAAGDNVQRHKAGFAVTSDGIAMIPVLGTLMQRAAGMDALSGMESYGTIAQKIQAAADDPAVRGILLEIDSPGGQVAGAFDLAAQINAAGSKKPVWAVANEEAFSAAYLQAASAQRLSVAETGMVGSVGVIMMHVDQSAADKKKGYTFTPIIAGAHKADFSSHAPLSAAAHAAAQAETDRLYDIFVATVAGYRGIDDSAVRATQAALLDPATAKTMGMIDAVEPYRETLANFQSSLSSTRHFLPHNYAASAASKEPHMTTAAAGTGTPTPAAAGPTTEETARANAAAAEAANAKLQADAAAAATARIQSILGHAEAADRRSFAEHLAFKTTNSVEASIELLKAAAKETKGSTNALAEAMAQVPNPNVGADASSSSGDKNQRPAVLTSAEVFARRRKESAEVTQQTRAR